MMEQRPSISVVIPTYQRCASVRRALESLCHQSLAPDAYEVVVAVDGSTDGTDEMVAAFRAPFRLRALWQPNGGRAAACNAGVREARGYVVTLLDDDMQASVDLLATHLAEHPPESRRGILGAVPIRVDASSPPAVRFVGAKFNRHLEALATAGREIGIRDFFSGNFSIRRDVLLEVGGFDEAFRIYGNEDIDLAARLLHAGVELAYSPGAAALQHYEKDFAALALDHVAKGRTAVMCARKHPQVTHRLRLGTFQRGSRSSRAARAVLLAVSDHTGRVPDTIMRLLGSAERRWPARLLPYYSWALDYFFWFGVRSAMREHGAEHLRVLIYGRPSRGSVA
jgi:GT2 family glycosyltransferase